MAGLAAWGTNALISAAVESASAEWLADAILILVLALLLTPFLFVQLDRFSGRSFRWKTIGAGILIAIAAAAISILMLWFLRTKVSADSPILYRLAGWSLAASILGLGIGLRWIQSNRMRILHTYTGGLAGGLLGGLLFVGLGPHQPELCQAAGLMLMGAGIGLGAGLAPLLIRDGAVQFISSGDPRAQSKYGRSRKFWDLKHEETYVIGSLATSQSETRFQPGAEIFIPDASMAPRHAVLYSKEGRFYIARHPDAGGPAGIAKYVLRVRGKTVTTSQEVTESDDILIGRTAFRFTAARQGE
ncbi:MAG TPA: FHA domain-containing protein [Pseudacidobacterium sp.]|nr:FHA domain-containing protein [Pseudacidobacterium sp.]